jgi:ABC-type sugar transport system permease subunit
LKTVPDDIYEAAEIDGAGILGKTRHIALPSIRMLIGINFVGAIIGAMKSGSEFIMAMTGGGPYTPYGATGGHRPAYLLGGHSATCASAPRRPWPWVLGSMLIGFTVFQLQRLSRMEFRAVGR